MRTLLLVKELEQRITKVLLLVLIHRLPEISLLRLVIIQWLPEIPLLQLVVMTLIRYLKLGTIGISRIQQKHIKG